MNHLLSLTFATVFVLCNVGAEELSPLDLKSGEQLLAEVRSFARSPQYEGSFPIDYRHFQFWELQSPYTPKRVHLWEQWRLEQSKRPENDSIRNWFPLVRHPAFKNTERLMELLKVGFTEAAFRCYAMNTLQPHIFLPELRKEMEQHKFAKESFDAFERCEQETLNRKREVPKKTDKFCGDIHLMGLEHLKANSDLQQILETVKSVYGQVSIDEDTNTVIFEDKAVNMDVIEGLLKSMDQYAGNMVLRK